MVDKLDLSSPNEVGHYRSTDITASHPTLSLPKSETPHVEDPEERSESGSVGNRGER